MDEAHLRLSGLSFSHGGGEARQEERTDNARAFDARLSVLSRQRPSCNRDRLPPALWVCFCFAVLLLLGRFLSHQLTSSSSLSSSSSSSSIVERAPLRIVYLVERKTKSRVRSLRFRQTMSVVSGVPATPVTDREESERAKKETSGPAARRTFTLGRVA